MKIADLLSRYTPAEIAEAEPSEPRRRGRPPLTGDDKHTPEWTKGYAAGYVAGLRRGRQERYVPAAEGVDPDWDTAD